MRKRYILVLIILMVIGFATITTQLVINGVIHIAGTPYSLDNDVKFTKALAEDGGKASILNDGKNITYVSKILTIVDDEAVLNFEITNFSKQYDALATIDCAPENIDDYKEYMDIVYPKQEYEIAASDKIEDSIVVKLVKSYVGEDIRETKFTCTIIAVPQKRDDSTDKEIELYDVTLEVEGVGSLSVENFQITLGGTYTFTATPGNGYYLSGVTCTNGYTANVQGGKTQKSTQIIDISNNNYATGSECIVLFGLDDWIFEYENEAQTFTVPYSGVYKIELWGASGGCYNQNGCAQNSGKGGYVSGEIELLKDKELYLYIGEEGKPGTSGDDISRQIGIGASSTFNGGGAGGNAGGGGLATNSYSSYLGGPSGGGATDIRTKDGNWDDFDSLKSRIMVAGGGGGYREFLGGNNLGLTGADGGAPSDFTNRRGIGATQTTGFVFGRGGNGDNTGSTYYCNGHAGGGGGYYGGIGGLSTGMYCYTIGGGAGSSFISGHIGANAIDSNSTSSKIMFTNQPNHDSGYIFDSTFMIGGNEFMPTYDWKSTMIGNRGDGYARITLLSIIN